MEKPLLFNLVTTEVEARVLTAVPAEQFSLSLQYNISNENFMVRYLITVCFVFLLHLFISSYR